MTVGAVQYPSGCAFGKGPARRHGQRSGFARHPQVIGSLPDPAITATKGGPGFTLHSEHRKTGEDGRKGRASVDPNQRLEERMQTNVSVRPVEQVVAAIRALDLDPIKFKLMDPEEGQGWSRAYADRLEVAYRGFLTLLVTHPGETLAPC